MNIPHEIYPVSVFLYFIHQTIHFYLHFILKLYLKTVQMTNKYIGCLNFLNGQFGCTWS